ncbi:hypothetical protein FNV43_RR03420 [Rhamnella rubrinervis]|uniref:GH18 domain-containing protein n=1 Tax=Rhamnella rubrinervis TaxID=2594499 RepID=A0A8K0HHQ6_9ROSA|nr:hypothetical protein FNV43_RR03420 [Rhamnella rubrinervis]
MQLTGPNGTSFPVANIDSTVFTHLICAFADLDPQTNQLTVCSSNIARYSSFTETVQRKNPTVKTLLSLGGSAANPSTLALMASQTNSRKSFIHSSISLARSYNFHGLDLDWEFPSSSTEMINLGTLLTEWQAAIIAESQTSGKQPLILTAAVYYSSTYRSLRYSNS